MSIRIMSAIWDADELKDAELLAMLALADHANDDGVCWPSIKRIARKIRRSERQTQRILNQLEQRGWITRESRPGKSRVYIVNVTPDIAMSPPANVTPDTAMSPPPPTQLCHPTPDTAMSPEPSYNHQDESSSISSSGSSDGDYAEIAQIAMSSGIYIGQIQSEMLADFIDEYGAANVKNAIAIAAGNGKLTLNYIGGILRRQRNGTAPQAKRTSTNNTNKEKDNGKDLLDGWLPINRTEIVGGADEPIDIDSITF